jgi:hypothetical protein
MSLPMVQLFAAQVALAQARGVDLNAPSYLELELLDELDREAEAPPVQP